jgi:tRNA threonylcarbamoyladenosine biosynthesis protein TsaB
MISLAIDAATYAGSVALFDGSRLLAERTVAMRGRDHEALMPAVADVLAEQGFAPARLGRIVCGEGPGSFTSLRIAGGIAKGLVLSLGIPLVPVSSLALVVASQDSLREGRYLAAIDALRGEHYVELYDVASDGAVRLLAPTRLVPSESVSAVAAEQSARAVGPGQAGGGAPPHARAAALLTAVIESSRPADLARWEPRYGRLAEAQVKWEAAHGPLAVSS